MRLNLFGRLSMEPLHISIGLYVVLFATGLLAGFVDSIAGGGGLISLPVLLSAGLPPQLALGTNKLQGSFGSFSAAFNYISKGKTHFRTLYPGIAFTFLGAVAGAWAIQQLDPVLSQASDCRPAAGCPGLHALEQKPGP